MQYAIRRIHRIIGIITAVLLFTIFVCPQLASPKDVPNNFVLMYQFIEPIKDRSGSRIIGIEAITGKELISSDKTPDLFFDDLYILEGCNISNIQIIPPGYGRRTSTAVIYCTKQ